MTDLSTKQKAYRLGIRGENLAAWYLRCKGFAILERRYKTRYGEIDLIARRFNLVAIVEVKARENVLKASEAIDAKARKRIEASALYWLSRQKHREFLRIRFDLIAICPYSFPHHIPAFFG